MFPQSVEISLTFYSPCFLSAWESRFERNVYHGPDYLH